MQLPDQVCDCDYGKPDGCVSSALRPSPENDRSQGSNISATKKSTSVFAHSWSGGLPSVVLFCDPFVHPTLGRTDLMLARPSAASWAHPCALFQRLFHSPGLPTAHLPTTPTWPWFARLFSTFHREEVDSVVGREQRGNLICKFGTILEF